MNKFVLKAPYQPTGDQPQVIAELVKGFKEGNQCQTLLGVTGSGKTFTMANVIEQLQKPTLVIAHNNCRSPLRRPHSDKISHKLGLAAHEKPFPNTL